MLISTILAVFAVPYASAKYLEDPFTDDEGNDHSVWIEVNESYKQVYYSNNVSGNDIDIGEKITDSSVDKTDPQIYIDSTSGFGYILWYNESGQEFCYCGTNDILNKTPENITWGGIRYVDINDSINATTLNMVAQNYTLNVTWQNSTGPNYMIIYPDIDGDEISDIDDVGHIWSIILCGNEKQSNRYHTEASGNEAARQMYNTLLNHTYSLASNKITTYQKNDIYLMSGYYNDDDVDKNGIDTDDVDILSTKSNLNDALTNESMNTSWLLNQTGDGYRADSDDIIFIYLMSHGEKDSTSTESIFYCNYPNASSKLKSSELNYWLNDMEEKTNVKTTCVLIEACESGGFIGNLTYGGISQSNNTNTSRIVITSTHRDAYASAAFLDLGEDDYGIGDYNISFNPPFSTSFINAIDAGKSIKDAFIQAELFSEGNNNYITFRGLTYNHEYDYPFDSYNPLLPSNPKLDDNGDGSGSDGNELSESTGEDGAIVNSLFLTIPERYNPDEDAEDDSDFISYDEVETLLNNMALRHPYICNLTSIGNSENGKDIWALKISDNPEIDQNEMEILIVAAIHGDEKMGTEFCIAYIQHLIDNYFVNDTITKYIDSKEIFIIPILNPDGYVSNDRENANNEDLNRNFWYPGRNLTTDPCFTENETQAFKSFIDSHNLSLSMTLHGDINGTYDWSDGKNVQGAVLYPYHYVDDYPGADEDVYNQTATNLTEILGVFNGTGNSFDVLNYSAPGNTDDWLYINHSCIAISTEIENATLSAFNWQWEKYLNAFYYLNNISTITIVSPLNEEILKGSFVINWTVSDDTLITRDNYTTIIEYGEGAYQPYPFYLNWHQITEVNNPSITTYSWNTSELDDGSYVLKLTTKDTSNNMNLSVDFKLITISNGEWISTSSKSKDRHVSIVYEGKNLLSPSGQDVKNASVLLDDRDHYWQCLTSVGYYDQTTGNISWRTVLANGAQTGDDFDLETGTAYWFNFTDMVREHFDIHFEGPEIEESIPLYLKANQANYVGFPYPANEYSAYGLLDQIPNCTQIRKWSASEQNWFTAAKDPIFGNTGTNFSIELGEGYMVFVDEDVVWPSSESPSTIWANKSGDDVRLEWSDGNGIFEIYVSSSLNGTGFNFSSPEAITSGIYWNNRYWIHEDVLGDGNNYSYVVRAKGNSTKSNIAWKFAKEIYTIPAGNVTWVSLPYYYDIGTLSELAEDIGNSIAWNVTVHNTTNQEYKYVVYNSTSSLWEGDTSYEIIPGDAVKIYCDTNGTWDIVGAHNVNLEISISEPGNPDANWISLPFHHNYDTLGELGPSIGNSITGQIRAWSAADQTYYTIGYDDLFGWFGDTTYSLSEGDAILVFCNAAADWQPDANNP